MPWYEQHQQIPAPRQCNFYREVRRCSAFAGAVFEATRERQYSSQAYQLGVVLHFVLTGGQCPVLWAPNQLHQVCDHADHCSNLRLLILVM